jgi:hypothetical protein
MVRLPTPETFFTPSAECWPFSSLCSMKFRPNRRLSPSLASDASRLIEKINQQYCVNLGPADVKSTSCLDQARREYLQYHPTVRSLKAGQRQGSLETSQRPPAQTAKRARIPAPEQIGHCHWHYTGWHHECMAAICNKPTAREPHWLPPLDRWPARCTVTNW